MSIIIPEQTQPTLARNVPIILSPNTKQAITLFKDLPTVNSIYRAYFLRYRIISEDRNRTSAWSPIYQVPYFFRHFRTSSTITVIRNEGLVTMSWLPVQITLETVGGLISYTPPGIIPGPVDPYSPFNPIYYTVGSSKEYDVWLRWDRGNGDGDWIYEERIGTTSLSVDIPSTWKINGITQSTQPNRLSIEIYLPGTPIIRGDGTPDDTDTPFLKIYQLFNFTV